MSTCNRTDPRWIVSVVESVNKKMKDTLAKVGRGPDKCMMDMICLILLLGILAVVYNMFVKKDSSSTSATTT